MHTLALIISLFTLQQPFVISAVFANKHYIPPEYTCIGTNVNPELRFKNIPGNTQSLALIMVDPDTAFGNFDHWVMWNIPVQNKIAQNSAPGKVGRNSRRENSYTGPCPPSGIHEYHFTVYALDTKLSLPDTAGKFSLLNAIQGHVIAQAELVGLFNK